VSWQCSTFLEKGKSSCHAKQIPEGTLYAESAEVLGLDAFDAEVFKMHITEIRVPEFNHLVFVFHDGHTVEKVWKDRSRSESWNDAMREDARQHQKGLIERSGD
jgi:hypothetical protein